MEKKLRDNLRIVSPAIHHTAFPRKRPMTSTRPGTGWTNCNDCQFIRAKSCMVSRWKRNSAPEVVQWPGDTEAASYERHKYIEKTDRL